MGLDQEGIVAYLNAEALVLARAENILKVGLDWPGIQPALLSLLAGLLYFEKLELGWKQHILFLHLALSLV